MKPLSQYNRNAKMLIKSSHMLHLSELIQWSTPLPLGIQLPTKHMLGRQCVSLALEQECKTVPWHKPQLTRKKINQIVFQ